MSHSEQKPDHHLKVKFPLGDTARDLLYRDFEADFTTSFTGSFNSTGSDTKIEVSSVKIQFFLTLRKFRKILRSLPTASLPSNLLQSAPRHGLTLLTSL